MSEKWGLGGCEVVCMGVVGRDCLSDGASGCRCRPQTRPGNNSHSVVWAVAFRTLGHSSHVSIITTGR